MRPATTFLRNGSHLNEANRGDLPLPTSNQLIQLILGVTPQLHDPNVQPACDKKSRSNQFASQQPRHPIPLTLNKDLELTKRIP